MVIFHLITPHSRSELKPVPFPSPIRRNPYIKRAACAIAWCVTRAQRERFVALTSRSKRFSQHRLAIQPEIALPEVS
jgi:hypothetical protein